jgi:hypothetical protein
MVGVDQIFFLNFYTLKVEVICPFKMFDHTYCILNSVRTKETFISIISVQDHIVAYWVSCTRGAFYTEKVDQSGNACELCLGGFWFCSVLGQSPDSCIVVFLIPLGHHDVMLFQPQLQCAPVSAGNMFQAVT